MRFVIGEQAFDAHSALAALGTDVARSAPLGAELVDDRGEVVARCERLWIDPAWLETWLPTEAWPDEPMAAPAHDLNELLADQSPLFLAGAADALEP